MKTILLFDAIAMWGSGSKTSGEEYARQIRCTVKSGPRTLDARLVLPMQTARSSVLILHGIGERLGYWGRAQDFLSAQGIASLIIDYSGYGKSEGAVTPANLRQDVIAGYAELLQLTPQARPPFVLGLSLGTGIAIDAAPYLSPAPSGIVLCKAFSSLRNGATAVCRSLPVLRHLSQWLPKLVPDLYRTVSSASAVAVPLLIVHSDADELFPVEMATTIFAAAKREPGRTVELAITSGYGHNEAYLRPSLGYWQPILDFIHRDFRNSVAHSEPPAKR